MIPIVTPAEMRAIDAAASEPVEVLVDRAGRAVARAAIRMMGGTYGRRVVVIAGPGNNGADGRVAAQVLARRGVRVRVVAPDEDRDGGHEIDRVDLVIDAAFGTGVSRPVELPRVADATPVLAVDIPSGVDGLTGVLHGDARRADETITFAALKPGLVLEPGRSFAGRVRVEPIAGIDVSGADAFAVDEADVAAWLAPRAVADHKWGSAVRIIGGSPGMTGAVELAAGAAHRFAGFVQVAHPADSPFDRPVEAVGLPLPARDWVASAANALERVHAVLVGPGLDPSAELGPVLAIERPLVVDASALQLHAVEVLARRSAPTVITPHDGEFARLGGSADDDRIAATRDLAARTRSVVLRKGPTTIIAAPDGAVRVVVDGGPELATAGSGDVLSGIIVGLLARGIAPLEAATAGAWLHAACGRARGEGLVASELADAVPSVLRRLRG